MILKKVLEALRALECEKIMHRDVKSDNILIDSDGRVCLTDFNSAFKIT